MKKIKLTTTIKRLIKHEASRASLDKISEYIGEHYSDDKSINLLTILEANGAAGCIWAFRTVEQEFEVIKPMLVSMACEFSEGVLPIYEAKYVGELSLRIAIEDARRWAENPTEENRQAAVHAADAAEAAYDAAHANAHAHAHAPAYDYDANYAAAPYHASVSAAYSAYAAVALADDYNDFSSFFHDIFHNAFNTAANAACGAAAYDAYGADTYAAYAAERNKQADIIRKYLSM